MPPSSHSTPPPCARASSTALRTNCDVLRRTGAPIRRPSPRRRPARRRPGSRPGRRNGRAARTPARRSASAHGEQRGQQQPPVPVGEHLAADQQDHALSPSPRRPSSTAAAVSSVVARERPDGGTGAAGGQQLGERASARLCASHAVSGRSPRRGRPAGRGRPRCRGRRRSRCRRARRHSATPVSDRPDHAGHARAEPLAGGDRRRDPALGDHDAGADAPRDLRQGGGDPPLAVRIAQRRIALTIGRDHRETAARASAAGPRRRRARPRPPRHRRASAATRLVDLRPPGCHCSSALELLGRGRRRTSRTRRARRARRRASGASPVAASRSAPPRTPGRSARSPARPHPRRLRRPRAMVCRSASVSASGTTTAGRARAAAVRRAPAATSRRPRRLPQTSSGTLVASAGGQPAAAALLGPAREVARSRRRDRRRARTRCWSSGTRRPSRSSRWTPPTVTRPAAGSAGTSSSGTFSRPARDRASAPPRTPPRRGPAACCHRAARRRARG